MTRNSKMILAIGLGSALLAALLAWLGVFQIPSERMAEAFQGSNWFPKLHLVESRWLESILAIALAVPAAFFLCQAVSHSQ
ncbi:MAG: hypothetical protein AAGC68_13235, partial [Verrucomicrobiota bacterium]